MWAADRPCISANKSIVEPDEVLHAQGNVLVQHGDKKFKAQMLKFDQVSNEIILLIWKSFMMVELLKSPLKRH